MRLCIGFLLGMVVASSGPPLAEAQSPQSPAEAKATGDRAGEAIVAATVDDKVIHAEDVERQVKRALRGRPVEAAARASLEAQALEQLVDQALILQYLRKHNFGATPDEVQLAVARLEKQLQRRDMPLAEYLAQQRLTPARLRDRLAWQIGWPRYLDRYLTEENLQNWFERHRAQFDGRRLRVAHILFRIPRAEISAPSEPRGSDDTDGPGKVGRRAPEDERGRALSEVLERARQVRAEIIDGKSSFADAARRHSQSPTARDGGELGWIERHQPMPEPFRRLLSP